MTDQINLDALIIGKLGGPAKLAKKLGYLDSRGTQRVHNWLTRGIPAKVRLEHAALFRSAERSIERDASAKLIAENVTAEAVAVALAEAAPAVAQAIAPAIAEAAPTIAAVIVTALVTPKQEG